MDSSQIESNQLVSSSSKPLKNIVLVGLPGSGKSTVGKHLSIIYGCGFIDLDAYIEGIAKKTIKDIFQESGEDGFRALESQAIQKIRDIKSHVIACGGGVLVDAMNRSTLRELGPIVWLKPSPMEIARRLHNRVGELEKRPMFAEAIKLSSAAERLEYVQAKIAKLLMDRSVGFDIADVVLDGGFVTPETSACQLKEILTSLGYSDFDFTGKGGLSRGHWQGGGQ